MGKYKKAFINAEDLRDGQLVKIAGLIYRVDFVTYGTIHGQSIRDLEVILTQNAAPLGVDRLIKIILGRHTPIEILT